ncbi:MAG: hypothetical protein HRT71_17565 [Flavobacteriales bacterium]|nr:hypothetical protein [Flavobacteriales bacterium]
MIRSLQLLVFLLFISFSASSQSDTTFYTLKTAKKANYWSVKKLNLKSCVTKNKKLPESILEYKNVTVLKLRPKIEERIKIEYSPDGIQYKDSKLEELPEWITQLEDLVVIDLIGNPTLNYYTELAKLKGLKNLRVLALEPYEVNSALVDKLAELNQLKFIYIKATETESIKIVLDKLTSALPNCKISCTYFADYCDKEY